MDRSKIAVIGGGMMGCGIATCSALAGNSTVVYDSMTDAASMIIGRVRENLAELVRYDMCNESDADAAAKRIQVIDSIEEACEETSTAIEAVFEKLELKQEVFQKLDAMLPPEVPILSNTSGLRITDISAKTKHPERTLTAHFWLPAILIPLVEVVIGDKSSPELAAKVSDMLRGWGKTPVIVKRDLPGQLANRILQAVIREAVNIVEIGLATAEDVDTAIKMGMALRFPVWGPLEHVDAVGFDICGPVQNTVLPEISARQDASPLFAEKAAQGMLGYKTGKGFYDWSKKDMDALVRLRNDFIVHSLKLIRETR